MDDTVDEANGDGAAGSRTPVAALFCTDLMFGVQLQNMARKAGFRPVTLRPGAPLPDADILIVDLAARGDWETAVREAASRHVPVVAFGPHMDADARRRARDAGASRVLANSNLTRDLPVILKSVVGIWVSTDYRMERDMPDIDGVVIKELVTHPDERGYFREMIRVTDPFFGEGFGQLSHSLMHPEVAKAWHIHKTQIDWWYVPMGVLKVALYDMRPDSPTKGVLQELFMGGEHGQKILKIPAGVAHGCKAIGGASHLIYVTSNVYDPQEEGRIPHDDPEIGYDWTAGPSIK